MAEEVKTFWIDHLPDGKGLGLGSLQFSHVHEDGTRHKTTLQTPKGAWGGPVGCFDPQLKVQCNSCQAVLSSSDEIKIE